MRLDKFTIKAQEAIQEAVSLAKGLNHQQADNEHLLLALLKQEESIIAELLAGLGLNTAAFNPGNRKRSQGAFQDLRQKPGGLFLYPDE